MKRVSQAQFFFTIRLTRVPVNRGKAQAMVCCSALEFCDSLLVEMCYGAMRFFMNLLSPQT